MLQELPSCYLFIEKYTPNTLNELLINKALLGSFIRLLWPILKHDYLGYHSFYFQRYIGVNQYMTETFKQTPKDDLRALYYAFLNNVPELEDKIMDSTYAYPMCYINPNFKRKFFAHILDIESIKKAVLYCFFVENNSTLYTRLINPTNTTYNRFSYYHDPYLVWRVIYALCICLTPQLLDYVYYLNNDLVKALLYRAYPNDNRVKAMCLDRINNYRVSYKVNSEPYALIDQEEEFWDFIIELYDYSNDDEILDAIRTKFGCNLPDRSYSIRSYMLDNIFLTWNKEYNDIASACSDLGVPVRPNRGVFV